MQATKVSTGVSSHLEKLANERRSAFGLEGQLPADSGDQLDLFAESRLRMLSIIQTNGPEEI